MSDVSKPLWRRVLRRTGILVSTVATAALAVGMVAGGSSLLSARAVKIDAGTVAPPTPVRVQSLEVVSGYQVPRRFVGQIEPPRKTDIGFEQGGTVTSVLVEEGQTVTKGQILARLDTRSLENQRDVQIAVRQSLEAQAELAKLTTERQQALEARGFSATQAFDQARLTLAGLEAQIVQTEATIAGIEITLDKTMIRAPFDGRIGARLIDEGTTVGGGTPIVTLFEAGPARMRVGLPPDLAATLTPGAEIAVRLAGQTLTARLDSLRPDLDPRTRTRAVILTLEPTDWIYGQTASVELVEQVVARGAWVPLPALKEGTRGLWTVLTMRPDGRAGQEAVEVLYADENRAFVRGTFQDGTHIIDSGPHRVIQGQQIAKIGE
ncbi:MAG: efflux RND transporter periplasmic adaptor subunit [Pseudomonadota bacterium]